MSGVYIHIPFCKKACHYCDFHFSTSLDLKNSFLKSLSKEIELQKRFLDSPIKSIYFGGGTPSLLEPIEIKNIIKDLKNQFDFNKNLEITLEANPDDFDDINKIKEFKKIGINRLSIGIQSFDPEVLKKLNRSHDAFQAEKAIESALKIGFDNFSCDLIYGIPFQGFETFKKSVDKLIEYQVPHISNYCLTIEEDTVFGKWQKTKKIDYPKDEDTIREFEYMQSTFSKNGYIQYEISNFAKSEYESFHNSNYWKNETYLGLGPSAHSYDGKNRFYNVSNNTKYIKSIQLESKIPFTIEKLSVQNRINEHIMTRLRTVWGVDLNFLKMTFSYDLIKENKEYINELLISELIIISDQTIILTNRGKLLGDEISSNLFA